MILERLDYILMKQRDIVNQIKTVIEKVENHQPIEQIGYIPDSFSPQDLINFHKDRYNILDIAKNYDNERLRKWLSEAERRRTGVRDKDYTTIAEIELLKGCLNGQD